MNWNTMSCIWTVRADHTSETAATYGVTNDGRWTIMWMQLKKELVETYARNDRKQH